MAILDDHPLMRTGIERVAEDAGFAVVHSGADVDAFEAAGSTPDVVLFDLYLSGAGPHLADVARISERLPVLILSASGRGRDVLAAIDAGARGYVTKQAGDVEFVTAVRTVSQGRFYLSAELADIMQAEADRRARAGAGPALSAREDQALQLIAEGFTHRQAATRMGVTTATFDTYVKRIRQKLGAGNKASLTRFALDPVAGPAQAEPI